VLGELRRTAAKIGGLELLLFGSAQRSTTPRDLDVLVLYDDPLKLSALVEADIWELYEPPIDLIGMTRSEDSELEFTAETGATPLY
jgi:predicted nucleotidyltransferase